MSRPSILPIYSNPSDPSPSVSQTIDVTARSLDLMKVLSESTSLASTVSNAAIETCNWLARERMPRKSFSLVMKVGSDFAHPNSHGSKITPGENVNISGILGLNLILPGAVGYSILHDEKLVWMASTQAVILKHHPLEFSVSFFTGVFEHQATKHSASSPDAYRVEELEVLRMRFRPVLEKVLKSIAMQTTNATAAGQDAFDVSPLPTDLSDIPGHVLDADDLRTAIILIQSYAKGNVLLRADNNIIDLLTWLYNHWHGTLVVCHRSDIIFEDKTGDQNSPHTFIFMIDNGTISCTSPDNCEEHDHYYAITPYTATDSSGHSSSRTRFHYGPTNPKDRHPRKIPRMEETVPSMRKPLYKLNCKHYGREYQWDARITDDLEVTVYKILHSIWWQPMKPYRSQGFPWIGLKINYDDESAENFRWWCLRFPQVLQTQKIVKPNVVPIFDPTAPDQPGLTEEEQQVGYRNVTINQVTRFEICLPDSSRDICLLYEQFLP